MNVVASPEEKPPIPFVVWQPHIVVLAEDGAHVYPIPFFRDFMENRDGVDDLPPEVMRAIIRDWLTLVETYGTFVPADWLEW